MIEGLCKEIRDRDKPKPKPTIIESCIAKIKSEPLKNNYLEQ